MNVSGFSRTITVLPVGDISKSSAWYERVLSFETIYLHEGETPGEPANYAVLSHGELEVHLILDETPDVLDWTTEGLGYLYIRTRDLTGVFAEVEAANEPFEQEIEMMSWGARNFKLRDPSGNLISVEEER